MSELETLLDANDIDAAYVCGRIQTSQSLGSWDTTLENYRVRKVLEERRRLKSALRMAMEHIEHLTKSPKSDVGWVPSDVLAALRWEKAGT